jgi:hypothetical protein
MHILKAEQWRQDHLLLVTERVEIQLRVKKQQLHYTTPIWPLRTLIKTLQATLSPLSCRLLHLLVPVRQDKYQGWMCKTVTYNLHFQSGKLTRTH